MARYKVREVEAMQFPGRLDVGGATFLKFDNWLDEHTLGPCLYKDNILYVPNPVSASGYLACPPGYYVMIMGNRMVVQDAEYFEATYGEINDDA